MTKHLILSIFLTLVVSMAVFAGAGSVVPTGLGGAALKSASSVLSKSQPSHPPSGLPSNVASALPSVAVPSAIPSAPPIALPPLTDKEVKDLHREFDKAQATQMKALDHRQKVELKELDGAQKAAFNEWNDKEKKARRQFFKDHEKGPERRDYIKEFQNRRDKLFADQKADREKRKQEQTDQRKSVLEEQQKNLKAFEESLAKKERPDTALWPRPGT